MSKNKGCFTNECWCVSNGGKTCNHSFQSDMCYDRRICRGDSNFWCDDSKAAGCKTNECWCVSNGDTIVNDTCLPDECDERANCQGNGYWCDDSGNMLFIIKFRKICISHLSFHLIFRISHLFNRKYFYCPSHDYKSHNYYIKLSR